MSRIFTGASLHSYGWLNYCPCGWNQSPISLLFVEAGWYEWLKAPSFWSHGWSVNMASPHLEHLVYINHLALHGSSCQHNCQVGSDRATMSNKDTPVSWKILKSVEISPRARTKARPLWGGKILYYPVVMSIKWINICKALRILPGT